MINRFTIQVQKAASDAQSSPVAPATVEVDQNHTDVVSGPQIAAETLRCAQSNCGHRMQDHTDRALFGPGCAPPIQHGTASEGDG